MILRCSHHRWWLIAALALPMTHAVAELRPQWEIGAGAAALNLRDYRGSNEYLSLIHI